MQNNTSVGNMQHARRCEVYVLLPALRLSSVVVVSVRIERPTIMILRRLRGRDYDGLTRDGAGSWWSAVLGWENALVAVNYAMAIVWVPDPWVRCGAWGSRLDFLSLLNKIEVGFDLFSLAQKQLPASVAGETSPALEAHRDSRDNRRWFQELLAAKMRSSDMGRRHLG